MKPRGHQEILIAIPARSVKQEVLERLKGLEWRQQARDARRARRLAQKKAGKRPPIVQEKFWEEPT